jgi:hypothetical protein
MIPGDIILSEISQSQKGKYGIILVILGTLGHSNL